MNLKKIFVAGLGFLSVFAGAEVTANMQLRVEAGKKDLYAKPVLAANGTFTAAVKNTDNSVLRIDRARVILGKHAGPYTGEVILDSWDGGSTFNIMTMTASYDFDQYAKITFGKLSPIATTELLSAISPSVAQTAFGSIAGWLHGINEVSLTSDSQYNTGTHAGACLSGAGELSEGLTAVYEFNAWEAIEGTPSLNALDVVLDEASSSYSLAMSLRTGFAFSNDMGSASLTLAYSSVPEAITQTFNNNADPGVPLAVVLFDKTNAYNAGFAIASSGAFAEAETVMKKYNYKGIDYAQNGGSAAATAFTDLVTADKFKDLVVDAYRATVGYVITGQQRHAGAFALTPVDAAADELAVEAYLTWSYAKNTLGNNARALNAVSTNGTSNTSNADAGTAIIAADTYNVTFEHKQTDYSLGVNAYMGPLAIRANYLMVSSDKYTSGAGTPTEETDGNKTTIRFDLSI